MRGIDYRADDKGICLLIAKPFSHQREALQAANPRPGEDRSKIAAPATLMEHKISAGERP